VLTIVGEFVSADENFERSPVTFSFDGTVKKDDKEYPAIVAFITGKPSRIWTDVRYTIPFDLRM
jgi:hypothetical protein